MTKFITSTVRLQLSSLIVGLSGGAENAGVENAGVENAGVDSRGGKCRSDKVWKAVKIEKSKIPEVYAKTKRTPEQRPDVHIQAVTDSRFE